MEKKENTYILTHNTKFTSTSIIMPTMERVLVYKPDADAVASSSTIAIQNESESSNSDDTVNTTKRQLEEARIEISRLRYSLSLNQQYLQAVLANNKLLIELFRKEKQHFHNEMDRLSYVRDLLNFFNPDKNDDIFEGW